MAFIKKFPQTTFNLPDGSSIEAVNILKSFYFSDSTINNTNIYSKKYGVTTTKIENLSYELYGDKPSLYWITLYLNQIDSFSTCPIRQDKFESNLNSIYSGKVYYIKEGKDVPNVLPGDMIQITTGSGESRDWKFAGIVKEYDQKFRRVVLNREYPNEDNSTALPGGSDTFYDTSFQSFRKNQDSWEQVYGDPDLDGYSGITVGKVENEIDKILGIYVSGIDSRELSPFYVIEGNNFDGVSYDFSAGPTSDTVIYKLSSESSTPSELSSTFFDTVKKSEVRKNTSANTIKYFPTERAFQINTFVGDLLKTEFKRGRVITIT